MKWTDEEERQQERREKKERGKEDGSMNESYESPRPVTFVPSSPFLHHLAFPIYMQYVLNATRASAIIAASDSADVSITSLSVRVSKQARVNERAIVASHPSLLPPPRRRLQRPPFVERGYRHPSHQSALPPIAHGAIGLIHVKGYRRRACAFRLLHA
jgi:hypothetical protein